jgi:hypothetical protein
LNDWQIIQQDRLGYGTLALKGRWRPDATGESGTVEVRVVAQDTGVAASRDVDWRPTTTRPDGTWEIILDRVPAGGLYRIETHLRPGAAAAEWSVRGDMRHCIGVGDLWVIAGQSNSAGYGRGPVFDPPELGVHLYRNSAQWALATHPMNESSDTMHPVNRENGNPSHSPYLHFGRTLKQALGYPIGLMQTALGGSPLSRWNPTEGADASGADLFANMVECVRDVGGRVKGVLWYQGESDASDGLAVTYESRFIAAVQAWRAALEDSNLAVITVQLNRVFPPLNTAEGEVPPSHCAWSIVREAQRQAPHKLPGVAVVPALDLPLSDLIHTSAAGNMLLGERMARAALGMVHGRAVSYIAPDLLSATRENDGDSVRLRFANVTSRMDSIDQTANGFVVEDVLGQVPIPSVAYPGDETIVLTLARPLAEGAVVHGAYGFNPLTAPVDMDRVMPMLGFYGVSIA